MAGNVPKMNAEMNSRDTGVEWDGDDTLDEVDFADLGLNPSSRVVKLSDPKGVVEIMKCSRCETIPIPPKVAICNGGHYICGPCVRTVGVSALCVKTVKKIDKECQGQVVSAECGQTIGRYKSELYEYLYKASTFCCPNAEAGCTKTPLGSAMKAHAKLCPYRPTLPCPFTKCPTPTGLVSPLAYVKHVEIYHPNTLSLNSCMGKIQIMDERMNDPASSENPNFRWLSCLIHCFDLTFMLMVDERGGHINMWVSLAQDEGIVQGRKFQVRLNFCTTNLKAGAGGMWEGDIYPFEKGFEDIVTEGDLLFTTRAALTKRYLNRSGDIGSWHVDIRIFEPLYIYADKTKPGAELYVHTPYENSLIEKLYEVPATAPPPASPALAEVPEDKEIEAKPENIDNGDETIPDLTHEILAQEIKEIEKEVAEQEEKKQVEAAAARREQEKNGQKEVHKAAKQIKGQGQNQSQSQSQRPVPKQRLQITLTSNPFNFNPCQKNEDLRPIDEDDDEEDNAFGEEVVNGAAGNDGKELTKAQRCLLELQDLIEKKDFTRYSAYYHC